jgi:hypothetical protein
MLRFVKHSIGTELSLRHRSKAASTSVCVRSPPRSVHEAIQDDVQVDSLALFCQLCDGGTHILPGESHVADVINYLHHIQGHETAINERRLSKPGL